MLRVQVLFSTIALFVRIELLCSSIRRLPPNRAIRVAVFEGSPIRYNTRISYRYVLNHMPLLGKCHLPKLQCPW